jgi:hypothetical protein
MAEIALIAISAPVITFSFKSHDNHGLTLAFLLQKNCMVFFYYFYTIRLLPVPDHGRDRETDPYPPSSTARE